MNMVKFESRPSLPSWGLWNTTKMWCSSLIRSTPLDLRPHELELIIGCIFRHRCFYSPLLNSDYRTCVVVVDRSFPSKHLASVLSVWGCQAVVTSMGYPAWLYCMVISFRYDCPDGVCMSWIVSSSLLPTAKLIHPWLVVYWFHAVGAGRSSHPLSIFPACHGPLEVEVTGGTWTMTRTASRQLPSDMPRRISSFLSLVRGGTQWAQTN